MEVVPTLFKVELMLLFDKDHEEPLEAPYTIKREIANRGPEQLVFNIPGMTQLSDLYLFLMRCGGEGGLP